MNLFVKGEYGRVMTITPEELKENSVSRLTSLRSVSK